MTHWDVYNTFERLLILLGIIFLCIIIAFMFGFIIFAIEEVLSKKKAAKKAQAQNPIRMPPKTVRYDWKDRIY